MGRSAAYSPAWRKQPWDFTADHPADTYRHLFYYSYTIFTLAFVSGYGEGTPAKYNPGAVVKNSLVASGCIINGTVENSVLFKDVYIGNNSVIRNSVILNDVYIGDNTLIENCIVESTGTIRANSEFRGEEGIKIVVEKNERYIL